MNPSPKQVAKEVAEKYCGSSHGALLREGGGCQMCHLRAEAIATAISKAVEAAVESERNRAEGIARDRASLWRSHGGCPIGGASSHLTVEGECDLIADLIVRSKKEVKNG